MTESKYYEIVTVFKILAIVLGLVLLGILFYSEQTTFYDVDGDICEFLAHTKSGIKISDCESGLTYINPPTYREVEINKSD